VNDAPPRPLDGEDTAAWGRQAPYTMAPDWVALSVISNTAKTLFWHIAMHINNARGDDAAWPGRATLARRLGLSRADKADRYIKELIVLGAIEKTERTRTDGGNLTNHYVVHQTPPPGYEGPHSLADAYAQEKTEAPASAQASGGPPKEGPPGPRKGAPQPPKEDGGGAPKEGPNHKKKNQTNSQPPTGVESRALAHTGAHDARVCARDIQPPLDLGETKIEPQKPTARGRRKRTSLWPGEFVPETRHLEWAAKHHPAIDVQAATAEFNAYWDALDSDAQTERDRPEKDWAATWRKRIEMLAKRGWRPRTITPMRDELAQVASLADRWWGWCQTNGRIFTEQRSALEARLVEFLRAGATEAQLAQALWACQEPVPPGWKVAKALRGEIQPPPVNGHRQTGGRSTTDERVAQADEAALAAVAELRAERGQGPLPDDTPPGGRVIRGAAW
jgi:hypothetical protein